MAVLVFLVITPFLSALLASVILAYVFYPLYKWIHKRVKMENIAAVIVSAIIVLGLILPLFFVLDTLTREAYVNYLTSKQKVLEAGIILKNCPQKIPFCEPIRYIGEFFTDPKVKYHLQANIERITSYIIESASKLVFSIPKFILNFFVMIFTMFYLLKDGPKMLIKLKKVLPLKEIYKRHLFEKMDKVIFAIVYGYIVVGVIQGAFGAVGFFIFRVNSPIIWGIVMAFTALIPFLGTWIVWLPPALVKLINGISTGNLWETIGGILFVLYGLIIIGGIDNIIRPKIIGGKADVHPVLVLVGVVGGLYLLGIVGVVIGPLILALFIKFIKVYEEDKDIKKI